MFFFLYYDYRILYVRVNVRLKIAGVQVRTPSDTDARTCARKKTTFTAYLRVSGRPLRTRVRITGILGRLRGRMGLHFAARTYARKT